MPALDDKLDQLSVRQAAILEAIKIRIIAAPEAFVTKLYTLEKVRRDFKVLEDLGLIQPYLSKWTTIKMWVYVRTYNKKGMRADK